MGSPLSGKVVAVTGAGGFFGSHLVRELLLRHDANVVAFLRYTSSQARGQLAGLNHERLDVVRGDVRDPGSVRRLVAGADIVFHLAALVSVPHSSLDPGAHVATNYEGTFNLLQACRDVGVGRLVYVSSSEVYGSAQYEPIDEAHPLVAQSPYAATKIAAEKLCESFCFSYGLPGTIVRPFNLYGPGQSTRAVIPTIVAQALMSSTIEIGNTTSCRDFNYVEDVADAITRIAAHTEADNRVINIGTGVARSVQNVVDMVGRLLDTELCVRSDPDRLRPEGSEAQRLRADNTRQRELLGRTERTPFEVGLANVIDRLRHEDVDVGYAV